ncbi:ABC transporter permease [Achromobacter kerstersii]|uniref:ABC transporter permease n=1 Tax=Achromobacter kerstersii TaxID=1353890 RepID=UPI003CFF41D1
MRKRTAFGINRAVVFALVLREMRTRFGERRMGAFWMLFEPVAHVVAIMFIFTVLRGRHLSGFDYPVFLISGMIPFFLMRNIAFKLMDSIGANRSLFSYPNIKIFDTYVARTIIECALHVCVFVIIAVAMWWIFGYDVSVYRPLALAAILIVGVAVAFGLGLVLSVITEAMPNSKTFIRIMFMPLYLISGVIVPVWAIPKAYLEWVLWNPFLYIIDNIRWAYFEHYPVAPELGMGYPIAVALVLMVAGLALYHLRKRELLAL